MKYIPTIISHGGGSAGIAPDGGSGFIGDGGTACIGDGGWAFMGDGGTQVIRSTETI